MKLRTERKENNEKNIKDANQVSNPETRVNEDEAVASNNKRETNNPQTEQIIAQLTAELQAEKERRLRLLAEYDNYRRRSAQDLQNANRESKERILTTLLPVIDDLERFLQQDLSNVNVETLIAGVVQVNRKLWDHLGALGLNPIDALTQPFDFNLHEAVFQSPKEGVPVDTVIAEVQRGYMLGDRVLRHSKVVVSVKPSNEDALGGAIG